MGINFNSIYETYVRVPLPCSWDDYIWLLRSKAIPLITDLRNRKLIGWYCFLFHPLPGYKDRVGLHIRMELLNDHGPEGLRKVLPDFCELTEKLDKETLLDKISGIDKDILKDSNLAEAWRILGECSEWIVSMLGVHKEGVKIPIQQVYQFLHYFANALLCDVRLS